MEVQEKDIKVLFVSYNGLLEPILPSQGIPYLKELSKKGIDFILFTFEKKQDLIRTGKVKLEKIRQQLKGNGIKWVWLKYHRNPPGISTQIDIILCTIFSFYLILCYNIKVIHIRGITLSPMMILFSKLFKIKFIFDMRGLLAEEYVGGGLWKENQTIFKIVKWIERLLLHSADAIVVLTKKHYDLNMNLPYLKKRNTPMEVIPCCVDLNRFSDNNCAAKETLKDNNWQGKFIFMYPGKIGTFYLIDKMLDFFNFALTIIPDSLFVLLTQDNEKPLLNSAKAKNIDLQKIKIVKPDFEEIPGYLSLASCGLFFINPYKKIGSSPIKLGEFLACGVPVIINPGIGDTEELVRDKRVGVLVDNFTNQDYDKALIELLRLKQEQALSYRCRQVAKDYLSLELATERYWKIYQKVMSRVE